MNVTIHNSNILSPRFQNGKTTGTSPLQQNWSFTMSELLRHQTGTTGLGPILFPSWRKAIALSGFLMRHMNGKHTGTLADWGD